MNRIYHCRSKKIKKDINIFLVSDFHYTNEKDLKNYHFIIEELEKNKPNFLFLGGDILDSATVSDEDLLLREIEKWAKETVVIIGIGNHDITIVKNKKTLYYKNESFWNKLKKIKNVVILDDDCYEEKEFRIIGITVPYSSYYKNKNITEFLEEHIKKYDNQKMNLLLIHSANFLYSEKSDILLQNIDFVLSGHNHNGMVPKIFEKIMKHRGIISPSKKLLPSYVRGKFKRYNTTFIISGGMTKLSKRSGLHFLNRFWNHELTKITIHSSDALYK